MAIRVELNEFKMKEMSVHNESRKNTLFYDVGTGSFFQRIMSQYFEPSYHGKKVDLQPRFLKHRNLKNLTVPICHQHHFVTHGSLRQLIVSSFDNIKLISQFFMGSDFIIIILRR